MQYHEIVKAEVLGFVLNNVEGFNIFDKIHIKMIDVHHPGYEGINRVPFFEIDYRKGFTLANTFNHIDDEYINQRTLNYALNLCFNSEMSFKCEHNRFISECFSCTYYCIFENMYRTLSEKESGKVRWWID
ncbi:hypothetical protein [Klebsiella oxytoca]|uniref:hypothetical protein n=1 Tax=Klebsiella oxytoca TaxID=571 RepID=UPI0007CBE267|nr:hypothetical protein [Klebsiella oxytoca]SAQ61646.1 Uncharacterised protein [Klebsiella oxytoca]SAQ64545.1 Uncharacterised protein [Klebsiella oxytoca]